MTVTLSHTVFTLMFKQSTIISCLNNFFEKRHLLYKEDAMLIQTILYDKNIKFWVNKTRIIYSCHHHKMAKAVLLYSNSTLKVAVANFLNEYTS